jgi:hypothetical protein
MNKLRALFLDGNPILGIISPYRKKVVLAFVSIFSHTHSNTIIQILLKLICSVL